MSMSCVMSRCVQSRRYALLTAFMALVGCACSDIPARQSTATATTAVATVTASTSAMTMTGLDIVDDRASDVITQPDGGEASTSRATPTRMLEVDWTAQRYFEHGLAPKWPFQGIVQLYIPSWSSGVTEDPSQGWHLRYLGWSADGEVATQVPLESFDLGCMGHVAMVSHGPEGIEIGEITADGKTGDAFYHVPWGGTAQHLQQPTDELVREADERPSNIDVAIYGNRLTLSDRESQQVVDLRSDGHNTPWTAQARHDGELFIVTVHPAHLPCYSGVSWISLANTGQMLSCGANTWATRWIQPVGYLSRSLVLPDLSQAGEYLACAPRLNLESLPVRFVPKSS